MLCYKANVLHLMIITGFMIIMLLNKLLTNNGFIYFQFKPKKCEVEIAIFVV